MRPPIAGASLEVIEHHAHEHERHCGDAGHHEMTCPCGATIVLFCDGCRRPLFMAVEPGSWCEHAAWFWREAMAA